jgi:hypothetical protein
MFRPSGIAPPEAGKSASLRQGSLRSRLAGLRVGDRASGKSRILKDTVPRRSKCAIGDTVNAQKRGFGVNSV